MTFDFVNARNYAAITFKCKNIKNTKMFLFTN